MSHPQQITVLVTGANGQLGRELRQLANNPHTPNFVFTDVEELDITNGHAVDAFIDELNPHFIINAAAYTAVDRAEEDADTAFLLNAVAVDHLAQSAKRVGAKLIHISTDYVFNGQGYRPYTEQDATQPQSVYGHSKLKGEENALASGVGMVIRTAWLYSAHGHNFVKTILAKSEQGNLRVVYDQIGSPTWANDLAQVILQIIHQSQDEFRNEIFHYTNEGVCSWYDFAKEILRIKGRSCEVEAVMSSEFKTLARRPYYSVLNKHKIKRTFSLDIPHWRDSLEKCLHIMG